jgi:hypothetical protein
MLSSLLARAVCLSLLWRFGANTLPRRSAPRVYRRQVAAVAQVGPRLIGIRLQVVLA